MPEPGAGDTRSNQSPPEERNAPRPEPDTRKDFYLILGVSKTASADDIRKQGHKRILELHPDVNPGDKDAEERLKAVTEAYDILKDEKQRRRYDELREMEAFFASRERSSSKPGAGTSSTGSEDSTSGGMDSNAQESNNFANSSGASGDEPTGTNMDADSGQDAQTGSAEAQSTPKPPEWWETYYSAYDTFFFEGLNDQEKSAYAERSHMQPPDDEGVKERESAARDRITGSVHESFNFRFESLNRENKQELQKLSEALKKGKLSYSEYLRAFDVSRDKYYDQWHGINVQKNKTFSKRFHKEAKWGVIAGFGQQATATGAFDIETAIYDRLVQEEHASVEPKIYFLPDGTFVRVSWSVAERETPLEEVTARIEHITGKRDEYGGFHSKGVEIIREGQKPGNTFWLRRITRPYNFHLLDYSQRMIAVSLYSDRFEPYGTILTEGEITKSELKEYMAMLQQAEPAFQKQ